MTRLSSDSRPTKRNALRSRRADRRDSLRFPAKRPNLLFDITAISKVEMTKAQSLGFPSQAQVPRLPHRNSRQDENGPEASRTAQFARRCCPGTHGPGVRHCRALGGIVFAGLWIAVEPRERTQNLENTFRAIARGRRSIMVAVLGAFVVIDQRVLGCVGLALRLGVARPAGFTLRKAKAARGRSPGRRQAAGGP